MKDKKAAIICDLDGTIALMNGKRSPFEFLKCDQDDPNLPVIDVLETMVKAKDWVTIFTTARMNVPIPKDMYRSIIYSGAREHKIRTSSDQVEFLISQWNIVACTDLEELKEHAFYNQSVKCRHHDCLREDDATQTAFIHLTDVYSLTLLWILQYVNLDWNYFKMFIRENDNNDKDRYVKLKLYEEQIKPDYDVKLVLDDRNQVVEMWRWGAKLPCLQVADGNF